MADCSATADGFRSGREENRRPLLIRQRRAVLDVSKDWEKMTALPELGVGDERAGGGPGFAACVAVTEGSAKEAMASPPSSSAHRRRIGGMPTVEFCSP